MSGENQPSQVPRPAITPLPATAPAQPQEVTCPNCLTSVPMGIPLCPKCGNALPPTWPAVPTSPPPHKPRIALIIGILLIVLLVAGVAGFVVYRNVQQQVLQAAKNIEQIAANQAPDRLQITCLTVQTDGSHLSYSPYGGFSGYATVSETFGVSNPTKFAMDVTWTITVNYTSIRLVLSSTASFQLPTNGTARPTFSFTITGHQYNALPPNPDFSSFIVTADGTYALTGTYGTYDLTQQATYDTSTNTGTSILGQSANLSRC